MDQRDNAQRDQWIGGQYPRQGRASDWLAVEVQVRVKDALGAAPVLDAEQQAIAGVVSVQR